MSGLRDTEARVTAEHAAVERLHAMHFDGTGCGTHGTSACLYCFGPSPASAREIAEAVLEVSLPIAVAPLLADNDRLRAENADLRGRPYLAGSWVQESLAHEWRDERDRLRARVAELERDLHVAGSIGSSLYWDKVAEVTALRDEFTTLVDQLRAQSVQRSATLSAHEMRHVIDGILRRVAAVPSSGAAPSGAPTTGGETKP